MELDELLAELADVATRLAELPDAAFEERLLLRMRQEELREISRDLVRRTGDPESALELGRRLEHLESERDRYLSARLGHSAAAQTGQGGGMDPKYVHDMHEAMDKSFQLDELNAEIDRLRRRLRRLEGDRHWGRQISPAPSRTDQKLTHDLPSTENPLNLLPLGYSHACSGSFFA